MSYSKWQRIVWTSMLAAMSSSLHAVDGVVLIDQNRALAGNVTPGDTPGFPVTISQPGSYRLSGNLTVPDAMTTAVHITADHVTLDLNGFNIIGPNVCTTNPTTCNASGSGVGVKAGDFINPNRPRGVRVLNGAVRGMGLHGIQIPGDDTVVERVNSHGNGGRGIAAGGSVIDSTASLNKESGITAATVSSSIARANGSSGITLFPGGVAIGNSSFDNDGNGMNLDRGIATGNAVNFNKGFGVYVGCPSSIVGNTVVGNQGGNMHIIIGVCTLANNAQ